jgi:hypothetical protein
VGPAGVGVLGGGLPAALTIVEGVFSEASIITPMTSILKILDLRIMIFSPFPKIKHLVRSFLISLAVT